MLRASGERLSRPPARGFSLLEVLVTGALFSVVMAGVYLLYITMQGTLTRGEMKSDLQQNARVGVDRMVQELRMAGYDPQNALGQVTDQRFNEIRAAGNGCLSFVTYWNDTDASPAVMRSVQVTYSLHDGTLRRRVDKWDSATFSGTSTQPLAESVNQLAFTYYDVFNRILKPSGAVTGGCPPGSTPSIPLLDSTQAAQVRRVGIILRTLETLPRMPSESYTLTSHVYLRNR
jgi:prepilin-type N-terminal cleavage/methylation domain-containing protein